MWTNPSHSIVRLFVVTAICTIYVFVSHKDPTLLQVHEISCFCVVCINRGSKERCENELHVHPRTLKRLKPCDNLEDRIIMFDLNEEVECGIGGEWIANVVCVGDNVVVIANNETNEQFWLLLVDKTIHVVHESFEKG
jgi:hypothetical protein